MSRFLDKEGLSYLWSKIKSLTTAINATIEDNELVTAAALNDLNSRVANVSQKKIISISSITNHEVTFSGITNAEVYNIFTGEDVDKYDIVVRYRDDDYTFGGGDGQLWYFSCIHEDVARTIMLEWEGDDSPAIAYYIELPIKNTYYGTCTTGKTITAKSVTCSTYDLHEGNIISVYFQNGFEAESATLNVRSTGAYPIYINSSAVSKNSFPSGPLTITFIFYDNRYYVTAITERNRHDPGYYSFSIDANNNVTLSGITVEEFVERCVYLNGNGATSDEPVILIGSPDFSYYYFLYVDTDDNGDSPITLYYASLGNNAIRVLKLEAEWIAPSYTTISLRVALSIQLPLNSIVTSASEGSISDGLLTMNRATNGGVYGVTTLTDIVDNVSNMALTPAALYSFGLSMNTALNGKVSTNNLKTINNLSLIGTGNITISSGSNVTVQQSAAESSPGTTITVGQNIYNIVAGNAPSGSTAASVAPSWASTLDLVKLPSNYAASSLSNEDLEPAAGDTHTTAISKLHKAILDNEDITATSLNDLNSRKVNKTDQSIVDSAQHVNTYDGTYGTAITIGTNAEGGTSTASLVEHSIVTGEITGILASDKLTIPTSAAVKKYVDDNALSGLNLKTINNQSLIGSGNLNTTNAPLLEKTYENYTCAAADVNKGYIYFMNVVPTSDSYFDPWYVHYILEITTGTPQCLGYYEVKAGFAGTTSQYRIFNRFYSTSYYPCYYHLMAWHSSSAKYTNKETNPVKFGVRIYSAYGATTVARTYNIKVIDAHNCTVAFPDSIETYDSFYNDTNYGYNTTWNATSNGGLDNYDANTAPYQYYECYSQYFIHSAETPLYRYKICGFDDDNRLIPITITNRTNSTQNTLIPCKVPMTVSRGLVYYAYTTDITTTTARTGYGTIYRGLEVSSSTIFQYNFNGLPGASKLIYLQGTYNLNLDTFILDDDYYVVVPDDITSANYSEYFTTGKYYWYLGCTATANANYGVFNLNNPLYQYNGTKLVPITSIISTSGGGGDTNVIETVKVNGTALTPDANKAVNITAVPASIVTADSTHRFVTDTEKTTWNNKVSNVQSDWNATTGNAVILNKPTIPTSLSDLLGSSDSIHVSLDAFDAKGTYSKPSGGIPKTDLASAVLTSLGLADTALQPSAIVDNTSFSSEHSKAPSGYAVSAALQGKADNATTLAGYGITDAKIESGTITLGSNTITPLTSHLSIKTINNNTITGTGNVTIATPGTLKTDNSTAQTTSNNESLSGTINLHQVSKTGNYNDLIDKPTIPSAVTESTVSGWGFTKNAGTLTGVTFNNTAATVSNGVASISYTAPVTSVNGNTGAVTLSIPAAPGTLNTNHSTALTVSSSEALSGTVHLHKISKTGSYTDLSNTPTITDNTEVTHIDDLQDLEINEGLLTAGAIYNVVTTAINAAKVTIYSGTAAPSNSLGTNGDLYLQTS